MRQQLHATRSDWLVLVSGLEPSTVMVIHPLDGLTDEAITAALKAQGFSPRDFIVTGHGNTRRIIRTSSYRRRE